MAHTIRNGMLAVLAFCAQAHAEQHTAGVPQLSSRPGAPYTIYIDVAGFNYDGIWLGDSTPGDTPALNDKAPNAVFGAQEQQQIKNIWQRVAQTYALFNVNVTTIDPATGANAATDAARRAFYDATPNLMHTVVGSSLRNGTSWDEGGDGDSALGVVTGIAVEKGNHTNWMHTEEEAGPARDGEINGGYIGHVISHENAHAFGLEHQSDYKGRKLKNDVSYGDSAQGNGSYVPVIGNGDGRQRVTWRVGETTVTDERDTRRVLTNDIRAMLAINTAARAAAEGRIGGVDLHFVDDGIGHRRADATPLPLAGTAVNSRLAQGVIVPRSRANPNPIGAANYTEDWFSFASDGKTRLSLTVFNGTQFFVSGVADSDGTLRSTLHIFDTTGAQIGTGVESADTMSVIYNAILPAGTYFARIASFGGHAQVNAAYNPASYYDAGAFFLTGKGFATRPLSPAR